MTDFVTLKSNSDFRRVYARGKVYTNPALVIYLMKNRAGICRIGITTSKKIGNAVERNRSKRVIRAAFRQLPDRLDGNFDIVFVARGRTKYTKSTELCGIMRKHFLSAGVIKNDSDFYKAD